VLQYTFPYTGSRVILFTGGPCTQGPGLIVGPDLTEPIRGYHEINKEMAVHVHSATKYYESLASRATTYCNTVDIFSSSLDQIGLLEMRSLPKSTGGIIVQAEDFTRDIFTRSLKNLFQLKGNELNMGFVTNIEISVSEELSICGGIGHFTSGFKKNKSVSENELGIGSTYLWTAASIDPSSTMTFFFEIKTPKDKTIPPDKNAMIQFRTSYYDSTGQRYLKVTTVAHAFVDTEISGPQALIPGFDQEACAAIISRLAIFKSENEDTDIIGWIDKHLINFCKRYAFEQNSFQLQEGISLYPEFIFHFRRGPLVSVFGSSPDQTVFYRYHLLRECTANSLIMIQPSLEAYSFNSSDPEPVVLSSMSIKPDRILLLDTFFHIVIFCGSTIAQWKKKGFHLQEEHQNFKELLEVPLEDVQDNLNDRFPTPLFVECDEGESQARYLLAVVDPSPPDFSESTYSINTDDASLQTFMEHLKKYVTTLQ
jgi:protein transport protein SEC23